MLYGLEIPQGVDGQPHTTEFIDLIEAYNNLERDRQKQLEQISFYHLSPRYSKLDVDVPYKIHPAISTHQVTGKKGLYLGSASAIPVGMEQQPEQASKFWREVLETVLECTTVYSHLWHEGDLVFWDNSQVIHRGNPYDSINSRRMALRLGVVDTTTYTNSP